MIFQSDVKGFFDSLREGGYKDLTGKILHAMKTMLGVDIDFTPNYDESQLAEFEKYVFISAQAAGEPIPPAVFGAGFYLGETIINNIEGAYWDFVAEEPDGISIVIPAGKDGQKFQVMPIVRVLKFLENPEEDTIISWYETIKFHVSGAFDPEKMPAGEWIELPNGSRVRYHVAEKEEENQQDERRA